MKTVVAISLLLGTAGCVVAGLALRRTVASEHYDVRLIHESIERVTGSIATLEERVTGIDEATKATFEALSDSLQRRALDQPPTRTYDDPRDGFRDGRISRLESEVRDLGEKVDDLQRREFARELDRRR